MVTAWGGDRPTEQQILGRVLQVMYDDAVIDGTRARRRARRHADRAAREPRSDAARGSSARLVGDRPAVPALGQLRGPRRRHRPRDLSRRRSGAESSHASGVDVMTLHSLEPSSVETRSAATPLWLRLRDTYTGRPPADVDVVLERKVGSGLGRPPAPAPDLVAGRSRVPQPRTRRHGARPARSTSESRALHRARSRRPARGEPALETTITIWTDQSPPVPTIDTDLVLPRARLRVQPSDPARSPAASSTAPVIP